MKNFVVLSDCSEAARTGMATAIQLAKKLNARLFFIYCISNPMVPSMASLDLRDELFEAERKKQLEILESQVRHLYAQLQIRAKEVPYSCIISVKPIEFALSIFSAKHKIDLIVMGTTGASGFRKVFIGSTAADVVRKSAWPVLIVPDEYEYGIFKKILFPINLEDFEIKSGLSVLSAIIKKFNAHLDFLYVLPSLDAVKEAEEKYNGLKEKLPFPKEHVAIHIKHSEKNISALENWKEEFDSDLVVLFPSNKTFLESILTGGGMTEDLIHKANWPLLILI